jgi:predicted nucleotidyltransferase
MVTMQEIQDVCDQIVRQFHPEKVILFGSYAYGTPRPDSDVDLLVVMPHEGHPAYQAARIRSALRSNFSMDVLVRDANTMRQRLEWNDLFLREVTERGRVMYESIIQ